MTSPKVSRTLRGLSASLCLSWLLVPLPFLHGKQKSTKTEQPTEQKYTDKDAYQIYSILLHKEAYSPVVASNTRRAFLVGDIKGTQQFDKLWRAVIEDCEKQSERPKLLLPQFSYGEYSLISSSEISALFKSKGLDEGWHAFHQRYPTSDGYYHFSAVGFDPGRSRAIVEMGHSCGPRCGEGNVYFFEKQAGSWSEIAWTPVFPT